MDFEELIDKITGLFALSLIKRNRKSCRDAHPGFVWYRTENDEIWLINKTTGQVTETDVYW